MTPTFKSICGFGLNAAMNINEFFSGVSRKSFLGRLLARTVDQRLAGTIAANLAALQSGATILRVHDVAAHRDAISVRGAIGDRR